MKFEDLRNSTEFAEALGLLASLIAAVMALRDAKKESEHDSEDHSTEVSPTADVQVQVLVSKEDIVGGKFSTFLKQNAVVMLFGVVCMQFLIILFIAWRLM